MQNKTNHFMQTKKPVKRQ